MIANAKVFITLRIKREISEKVSKRAQELGISTNAYITTILAKEVESIKNETQK